MSEEYLTKEELVEMERRKLAKQKVFRQEQIEVLVDAGFSKGQAEAILSVVEAVSDRCSKKP